MCPRRSTKDANVVDQHDNIRSLIDEEALPSLHDIRRIPKHCKAEKYGRQRGANGGRGSHPGEDVDHAGGVALLNEFSKWVADWNGGLACGVHTIPRLTLSGARSHVQ
jgi:hypothetical protein